MSMINDIFRSLCCFNIFKVGGTHNDVCVNWSLMVTNIDVLATTVSSPKQIVSDSFFNLFRGWIVGRYVLPICGLSATVFHQPQPEDSQKTRRSNKGTLTPMSESQSYFKLTSHATRYSVKHQLQWDVRIHRLMSVTGALFFCTKQLYLFVASLSARDVSFSPSEAGFRITVVTVVPNVACSSVQQMWHELLKKSSEQISLLWWWWRL